jgi:hypothetical protein
LAVSLVRHAATKTRPPSHKFLLTGASALTTAIIFWAQRLSLYNGEIEFVAIPNLTAKGNRTGPTKIQLQPNLF